MSQRGQSYHYCEKFGNKNVISQASNTTAWDITFLFPNFSQ